MSLQCPKCNTTNVDEAKFCKNCGTNIAEELKKKYEENDAKKRHSEELKRKQEAEKKEQEEARQKENAEHKQAEKSKYTSFSSTDTDENNSVDSDLIRRYQKEKIDANTKEESFPVVGFLIVIFFIMFVFISVYRNNQAIDSPSYENASTETNSTVESLNETSNKNTLIDNIQTNNIQQSNLLVEESNKFWDAKNFKYKNPKKSLEYLDRAIKLNPNNWIAYNNRGILKGQLGNENDAIADYVKAIKISPNDAQTIQNRGYSYWNLNQIQKAKEDGEKACNLGFCQLKKDIQKWEQDNLELNTETAPIEAENQRNIQEEKVYSNENKVNLGACKGCHGQNWEKSALGKSRIVANMSKEEVSEALIGYKRGTYGGSLAGIMRGQVSRYDENALNTTNVGY